MPTVINVRHGTSGELPMENPAKTKTHMEKKPDGKNMNTITDRKNREEKGRGGRGVVKVCDRKYLFQKKVRHFGHVSLLDYQDGGLSVWMAE